MYALAVLDADGDGVLTEAEVIYMFIYTSIYREGGETCIYLRLFSGFNYLVRRVRFFCL